MNTVLVTGPAGFLGYHVIKLLNDRGVKPRALIEASDSALSDPKTKKAMEALRTLDVEEVMGDYDDLSSLQAACEGVDTLFHLKFCINMGDGEAVEKQLHEQNVVATRNMLDAATAEGVDRILVSSSVLTIGLNPEPEPLKETADWDKYRFNLPYALSRRQAEQEALARPSGEELPVVSVVNPSFTLGPEDFVGAPANLLLDKMSNFWFRFTAPNGFSILDVRDYADGALKAAEKGLHGQRYILSGPNINSYLLLKEAAAVDGREAPKWLLPIPVWFVSLLTKVLAKVKKKPWPKGSPSITELWGKHAWYNTDLARNELGWETRPLRETVEDSLRWRRENASK
ncbi:MAG: NAD-dependent epimerase/dehydratase family protein [Pseudomonadota bacterium]